MNPGELRHGIIIQRHNGVKDGYDQIIDTEENWINEANVWAAVSPIAGKEYFAAETVNSEITHKIKIRYRQGIDSKMRIKFGIRIFEIVSPPINYKEKNVELQLMCRERI